MQGGTRVTPNCPPEQAGPLTLSLGSSLSQHMGTAPAPSSAGARGQHHLQHWPSAPGLAPRRWEWVLWTQWSPRISPPTGSRALGRRGHPSHPARLHRPQATSLRMQVELQTAANRKRQQEGTPTHAKLNQGTYCSAEQGGKSRAHLPLGQLRGTPALGGHPHTQTALYPGYENTLDMKMMRAQV